MQQLQTRLNLPDLHSQKIHSLPYFSKLKNEYLQKLTPYYTVPPFQLFLPANDEHFETSDNNIIQPIKKQRFLTSQRRNGITELGHKCLFSKECVRGAECLFYVCACPPKTIANKYGYCIFEGLNNIIQQYSSSEGEFKKKHLRDLSKITKNQFDIIQNSYLNDKSKHYINNHLTNDKNDQIINIFPGMPCSLSSKQKQKNKKIFKCAFDSICLNINNFNSSFNLLNNFQQNSSFCVCDQNFVTNSKGYCTLQNYSDIIGSINKNTL